MKTGGRQAQQSPLPSNARRGAQTNAPRGVRYHAMDVGPGGATLSQGLAEEPAAGKRITMCVAFSNGMVGQYITTCVALFEAGGHSAIFVFFIAQLWSRTLLSQTFVHFRLGNVQQRKKQ